jgi:hypothetical protein
MFRASLRPSSGGQTVFSLHMSQATYSTQLLKQPTPPSCSSNLLHPVAQATYSTQLLKRPTPSSCSSDLLHTVSQATYSTQCTQLASRLSTITTVTSGQITICSENAVWPPEDGRKDARSMLSNNLLPIKSLIVASSWSHTYLLIKDARSLEHKTDWC